MLEFDRMMEIASVLLGPNGCQWDKEQTFFSLQPYLLEESHELIEAIDSLDAKKIFEELGDVFYVLVFIAKLAEKEGFFTLEDALKSNVEKLIRRHPHVFGDVKVSTNEEILHNWEEIKKHEKDKQERKKLFDGIPPTLPSLPKAQKMAKKILKKSKNSKPLEKIYEEAEVGDMLWDMIMVAERLGIDAESALRRKLQTIEKMPESSL